MRLTSLPLVLCLVLIGTLVGGCGSAQGSGLAYRLTKGDDYRYQYYEWVSTRTPLTTAPTTSLEVTFDVTLSVAGVGRNEVRLDVTVSNIRARVLDGKVERDWQSTDTRSAALYLRPGTGEIIRSSGEISIDILHTQLNALQSIRQSLQQYPNRTVTPGAQWTSPVHGQLAKEIGLSDGFEAKVSYTADEVRLREEVARLAVAGAGDLSDGSGHLTIRTDALVSRQSGMPIEEQSHLRMESQQIVIEGRSSLRPIIR